MNLTPERWQQIARIYELAVDQDRRHARRVPLRGVRGRRDVAARSGVVAAPGGGAGRRRSAGVGHGGTIVRRWSRPSPWCDAGPVPHRRPSRRRGHGRSLPRHRHPPQSSGGNQGSSQRRRARSADARPVCPRSKGGCCAHAPAHLHAVRRRASRRGRLPRHGVPRRRHAGRAIGATGRCRWTWR